MYKITDEDINTALPIIYGKDVKTIEDVILLLHESYKIHKFDKTRMALYVRQYRFSLDLFIFGGVYFIAYPFLKRMVRKNKYENDYIELFRKEVDTHFMIKSEKIWLESV